MLSRPRRNRSSFGIRSLVRETRLDPGHLVLPLFVHEGAHDEPIEALPGHARLSILGAVARAREALVLGIPAVALFPAISSVVKDRHGSAALDANGLIPRTVQALKAEVPGLVVITDVALDPYSSDGHDGLVDNGQVLNDATLPLLAKMAVIHALAGADVVAPSDMMDGRVRAIRSALDEAGLHNTSICSYCVKYASAFYGPFRQALASAPRAGAGIPSDKATYQMDPANVREALREVALDEDEGADWLMVKPGLPYLDVIQTVRANTTLPVAAFHVSGEYAMLKAAATQGWIDFDAALLESLTALRRAGADVIFTYGALEAARLLAR